MRLLAAQIVVPTHVHTPRTMDVLLRYVLEFSVINFMNAIVIDYN
jgi:hypothetical protein